MNQLNIGLALEAGLCISLIAILLDKMSLAWANKQTDYFGNLTFYQRNKNLLFFGAIFVIGVILAYVGTFYSRGLLIIYLRFLIIKGYLLLIFGIKG